MIYVILFANVCLLVCGQLFWKLGLGSLKGGLTASNLFPLFLNPWILLGLFLYVIATVVWFYVLSKMPLSVAYPMQSLSYVLALFVSRYVLKEQVSWTQWAGVLIILVGVAVVHYQPAHTNLPVINPER